MKGVIGLILAVIGGIFSLLGIIGGALSAMYWFIVFLVLLMVKLIFSLNIAWFAWGLTTISVIGTPLWMLFGGLFLVLVSMAVGATIAVIGALLLGEL